MGKYELATSLHFRYDRSGKVPITNEIKRLFDCGFQNLDFNFLDMCTDKNSEFLKDGYLTWLEDCKRFGDKLGARFVQAHAPCESVYDKHSYDLLMELCIKAIKGCAVLGVPWMAFHPIPDCKERFDINEDNFEFNLKYFTELLNYAKEYNVGIAIEDVLPFIAGNEISNTVDDMIRLIDTLDSEYVGACWDFGHANLCAIVEGAEHLANQSEQIKKLGDRIKCTHVHDNNTKTFAQNRYGKKLRITDGITYIVFDEHIQPFMGDIDWKDAVAGLDAVGYKGYFTFEAHSVANTLPEEVVNDALIQLRKVGESIIAMSRG